MVHALSASGQIVPVDLLNLAQNLLNNKNKGLVKSCELGYGGSGFKFDNCEEEILKEQKKAFACSVFNICDDILDNSEIEEPMLFENSYKSHSLLKRFKDTILENSNLIIKSILSFDNSTKLICNIIK